MTLRAASLAVLLSVAGPSAAGAAELYCLTYDARTWGDGWVRPGPNDQGFTPPPELPLTRNLSPLEKDLGPFPPGLPGEGNAFEFWVNTKTGEWTERVIHGRAGTTDGGTFEILTDGTGYGADWVGVTPELAEMLRIDLKSSPMGFLRTRQHQWLETGTCIDTEGRQFFEGREVVE